MPPAWTASGTPSAPRERKGHSGTPLFVRLGWAAVADRTVWWQVEDEASMVQLLRDASRSTGALEFAPRPAPKDADATLLHAAAVRLAKEKVAEDHSSQDRVLMEEVKAIDDLLKAANLLVERLREWHALQDADVVRSATDAEALVKRVQEAKGDAAVMQDADQAVLHGFADALGSIQASWRAIEARVTDLMADVAPNLTATVGPMVGARLITIAGGLPRLGVLPAGTIQTLGAETALFRHIKEGTKPPKHGILYQHPLVFQAPSWQRGGIARVLANHAALAARADATTGNDLTASLQESLEADLKAQHARKPKPPRRPAGRPGGKGGQGRKGGPRKGAKKGPRGPNRGKGGRP